MVMLSSSQWLKWQKACEKVLMGRGILLPANQEVWGAMQAPMKGFGAPAEKEFGTFYVTKHTGGNMKHRT